MFQQLNAEGITVVLVTHDPNVAVFAHRTIRIVDGMVEGDEANPSKSRNRIAVVNLDGHEDGRDGEVTTATMDQGYGANRCKNIRLAVVAVWINRR